MGVRYRLTAQVITTLRQVNGIAGNVFGPGSRWKIEGRYNKWKHGLLMTETGSTGEYAYESIAKSSTDRICISVGNEELMEYSDPVDVLSPSCVDF